MNKIMSILHAGLTADEIIEALENYNIEYERKFGMDNTSTIIYDKYIVKFVNNICTEVLDKK